MGAMSETVAEALNEHLNAELYSAYLYLSMAAYFESEDLEGFAQWMKVQAREEMDHVVRMYGYINERDARVLLRSVAAPPNDWQSPLVAFEETLRHEREISERIHKLVELSQRENDHATNSFLQWFVSEQVEEEASVKKALQSVRLVEGAPGGLFLVDQTLGARVYRGEGATEA
jgi:ferritin